MSFNPPGKASVVISEPPGIFTLKTAADLL
jgi:hypothetical protein